MVEAEAACHDQRSYNSDGVGAMVAFVEDDPPYEKHWRMAHFSLVEQNLGNVHATAEEYTAVSQSDDNVDW